MTQDDFSAIINRRIDKIHKVLIAKGEEYSSTTDRLHNFKAAAQLAYPVITPEQALYGMLRKHLVSIQDMVQRGNPSHKLVDEKIGDAINYLILLEALFCE